MTKQLSIQAALDFAIKSFADLSDTAKLDAQLLLAHALKKPKIFLFTWPEKVLSEFEIICFKKLVSQRVEGHPIAHLIGERDFWNLTLEVNNSTLIPRPDTELLVETVLNSFDEIGHLAKSGQSTNVVSCLDLGTGTGAIALSLASELPNSHWTGVDFNENAVELAKRNAIKNNVQNCDFIQSNWFSALEDQFFSIIVSNPPYIDPVDSHLNNGDVRFEPKSALIADNFGMADLELIVNQAHKHLVKNGLLVLEHGYDQGEKVRGLMHLTGFSKVQTFKDLGQNDRVTTGYFL